MKFEVDMIVERGGPQDESFRLDVRFDAGPEITVICGASGAGKSTLLLALLGAHTPGSGRIRLGEQLLFDALAGVDLPVRRRNIGMVFQDAALFPHLDALDNVAFGLHGRDRRLRAQELLRHVDAERLAARKPAELSGGERQRVALARALAPGPGALLLDEPFSALDLPSRERLGTLLIHLQQEWNIPFLHVTHDLAEAMRLGHQLVLLEAGSIVQAGTPAEVVTRPDSVAAARVVGTENLFEGMVRERMPDQGCTRVDLGGTDVSIGLLDLQPGSCLTLGIRAEDILLSLDSIQRTSARNQLAGVIEEMRDIGHAVELRVTTPVPFRVLVTPAAVDELGLEKGLRVYLLIKASSFQRLL